MTTRRPDAAGGATPRRRSASASARPTAAGAAPDAAAPAPRSLAEDLRQRSDDSIAALLAARPDLVHPVPADLGALATRATTGPSAARALDRLDVFALQVTTALAALGEPADLRQLQEGLPDVDPALVAGVVDRLRVLALLWGRDHDLHLVRPVREALGTYPAGLGPAMAEGRRGVAPYADDPALVERTLTEAPDGAREALERLLWTSPVGRVEGADRPVSVESARTPVEWLLARHLLEPIAADTVIVPREVALPLRGGVLVPDLVPHPPSVDHTDRTPNLVDRTAGQQAFSFVRLVEDLLEAWSTAPPAVLRSGGLAVRDLTRTALGLDVDEEGAALVIETAYAAGLLAADGELDEVWCPTPAYDSWLTRSTAERWTLLAQTWLLMTRTPVLVAGRDDGGGRVNALARDLDRALTPEARRAVLDELVALEPGQSPSHHALLERLRWRRPRRTSPLWQAVVEAVPEEAERLGITGLGSLSTHGRMLLTSTLPDEASNEARAAARMPGRASVPAEVAAAVDAVLPEPLDHVLLQADLTAVAPGPLEGALAREIALMADVESTGGATVYRFTEATIRRALDAGRSATDILAMLSARSRTPVPQPLEYLVNDAARRHGALRVGVATAYLRCDDPATVTAALADRKLAALRLTRVADTVIVSASPIDLVLERLREAGYAPSAENAEGAVVVRRRDSRRTPTRPRPPRLSGEPPAPTEALLSAAVRALRAGETAAAHRPPAMPESGGSGRLPRSTTSETMAELRGALDRQKAIWIGYADSTGTATERVVEPLRLDGGFLTAYDLRTAEVRTFTVARITGVAAVADKAP
ncbi:helicase-associated domain-containing protein [Longivirga aurantiaca]|uniref:Helicase-associated domain-containing protein n=1 Tax=Longivirga aurantiaca TaxID=1837743 RepID=A0ABW1SWF7_9ACTN